MNPIIGYNILPKGYTLANLKTGQTLDTTDTAKSGNSVNGAPQTLQVTVASNSGSTAQVPSVYNELSSITLISPVVHWLPMLCSQDQEGWLRQLSTLR